MTSSSSLLRDVARSVHRPLMVAFAFSAGINLLMLVAPIYMMQIFDRVMASRSWDSLVHLTFIAVVALVALALLDAARARVLTAMGAHLERAAAPESFQRCVAGEHGQAYGAEAFRDLQLIRQTLGGPAIAALLDLPWIPSFFVVTVMIHPVIGLVAIAGAVVLTLLALASELVSRRRLREAASHSLAAMRQVDSAGRNAELVAANGMLKSLAQRWFRDADAASAAQLAAANRNSDLLAITRFVRLALQVGLLGLGAGLALGEEMTGGAALAATTIVNRALAPLEAILAGWRQLIQARGAWARLVIFLDDARTARPAMPLSAPTGELTLQAVSYVHSGSTRPVLDRVSLSLAPGESLAVLGPSGSGKSTLVRALIGALRPTAGDVRLDGAEVSEWDRADLGRHLGYLPQDVELFDGTVRENVARMGGAPAEEITAAAQLADAHRMILALPQGYETRVGAVRLSGGQRQRIALARAVLGAPKLVVLDEPDASLDAEGERALVRALARLKAAGSTVVVVTHRPGLIGAVDKVLVLRDGAVELLGPREEVGRELTRRRRIATEVALRPVAAPAA